MCSSSGNIQMFLNCSWCIICFDVYCLLFSSSWNEHVLEIVLPKPCCLGHIDVRFHLQQAFSIAPRIEATLLVQHINNIGSHRINRHSSATSVDDGVKFGLNGEELNGGWKDFNQVTTQSFLQRYNAEIVCGPLEIADFLDPSGQSGMVTFANSHLLKVKCKSLLIHLKALPPRDYSDKLSRVSAFNILSCNLFIVLNYGLSWFKFHGLFINLNFILAKY